jgi:hypothetical protein
MIALMAALLAPQEPALLKLNEPPRVGVDTRWTMTAEFSQASATAAVTRRVVRTLKPNGHLLRSTRGDTLIRQGSEETRLSMSEVTEAEADADGWILKITKGPQSADTLRTSRLTTFLRPAAPVAPGATWERKGEGWSYTANLVGLEGDLIKTRFVYEEAAGFRAEGGWQLRPDGAPVRCEITFSPGLPSQPKKMILEALSG